MEIQIIQETCIYRECGITFWITKQLKEQLLSSKETFYCPNGHQMCYMGESYANKILRLEREREQLLRENNIKITELRLQLEQKNKKKKTKK